ncbi:MAG: PPOX class F420-dependent oxidoreductase [Anaerolineales bacterium]
MTFHQFENETYLNIETFRKNGDSVKTPVWFSQDGATLWVWTEADSGKAKRVRRESRVRVAPCEANGAVRGTWVEARAQADDSAETLKFVSRRFRQKYGWMFFAFAAMGKLRRARYTAIKVEALH